MWTQYYSHGKLLLTGEYTVLDGGLSFALPTGFGQYLKVRQEQNENLIWTSFDNKNKVWFQAAFDLEHLQPSSTMDEDFYSEQVAHRLSDILMKSRELNPGFLASNSGVQVETHMNFNRHWGLGSSSTLINNIAQWANIDPYRLQQKTFGGSGYDIACAIHGNPLLYQLEDQRPKVSEITFDPPFKNRLYFVYLNRKQDSREGIRRYKSIEIDKLGLIGKISSLTKKLIRCADLTQFLELLAAHEKLMSDALQLPRVQDELFSDYKGIIKSLGAWGGDFVLAASDHEDPAYFISRGYKTVFSYNEMVR